MKWEKELKNKRALSFSQMLEARFPYENYDNFLEEGVYCGNLVMKSWGKNSSLHCYFELENGKKIRLTTYHPNYSPKKSEQNLSYLEIESDEKFKITVGKNGKGNTTFLDLE